MLRVLNDEEIQEEFTAYTEESRALWAGALSRDEKTEMAFALWTVPQRIAKSQFKADIEGFIEWLEENFGYYEPDNKSMPSLYTISVENWQEFKQLVEEK